MVVGWLVLLVGFVVWVVCLRFVVVYWLVLCCLVNAWCDVCLLVGVIVLCCLFVDCLVCLRCFFLIVLFRGCLDLYMVVWFWLRCCLGLLCWVFGFIVICLFTWLLHGCCFWLGACVCLLCCVVCCLFCYGFVGFVLFGWICW